MQLEIVRFGKSHGLHGNQLFKGLAVVQFGQLGETHTKKLILFQQVQFSFPEGINHKYLFPIGCRFGIRLLREVVLRQETVQFGEARVVFGQGHIQQFVVVSELHAEHGPHAFSATFHHEIGSTHRRVDVGQRQDGIAKRGGLPDQIRNRHRAIAQAVI